MKIDEKSIAASDCYSAAPSPHYTHHSEKKRAQLKSIYCAFCRSPTPDQAEKTKQDMHHFLQTVDKYALHRNVRARSLVQAHTS
jgi:hypothetical protein